MSWELFSARLRSPLTHVKNRYPSNAIKITPFRGKPSFTRSPLRMFLRTPMFASVYKFHQHVNTNVNVTNAPLVQQIQNGFKIFHVSEIHVQFPL